MRICIFLFLAIAITSCQPKEVIETSASNPDVHTFSNSSDVVVKHLDLEIKVDFDKSVISGVAKWTIENKTNADILILDTNTLNIERVILDDGQSANFKIGEEKAFVGRPLVIDIKPTTKDVRIYYSTSPDAIALQWLKPMQTAGKKYPFLFSQGESIWSRTWIPCQDSPAVRFTYNAKVTVDKNLIALMSGTNPQEKNQSGIYTFFQDKPIPSYLMAIAVGNIAFKKIDSRTGVYAEPAIIEKAAWEFAKLDEMVNAAEKLYGKYRWGRYDVLVLPPSFPYGGMENPNLTFLTPGVLAGDRSLTGLLAHELGHSWSGNLVTNATWDDIWLNEGFTTYIEHRIVEEVFGKDEADMQKVMSRRILDNNIEELGEDSPDTRLKVDTTGRNPDDGLSDVPYEKGYALLQMLEQNFGRERFDEFLKKYFNDHAFQSITTEDFVRYFIENTIKGDKGLAEKVQLDNWIYKPGIPSNIVPVHSTDFDKVDALQASWRTNGVKGISTKIVSTNEKIRFIDNLPSDLTAQEMATLDAEFHFTEKGNFVVKRQWFVLAIRHNYKSAYPNIEEFLMTSSRTGSLQTLYKEMVKTARGKAWARNIFNEAKPTYHLTTVQSVGKILE